MFFYTVYIVSTPISTTSRLRSTGNTIDVYIYQCDSVDTYLEMMGQDGIHMPTILYTSFVKTTEMQDPNFPVTTS